MAQILIDILTDRGYSTSHGTMVQHVPVSMDFTTGEHSRSESFAFELYLHQRMRRRVRTRQPPLTRVTPPPDVVRHTRLQCTSCGHASWMDTHVSALPTPPALVLPTRPLPVSGSGLAQPPSPTAIPARLVLLATLLDSEHLVLTCL